MGKDKRVNTLLDDINHVIKNRVPVEIDEMDCRWWMTTLAQAKSHTLRKIALLEREIKKHEMELEILECSILKQVHDGKEGSVTERSKISTHRFILHPNYKTHWNEIYDMQEKIANLRADYESINEKCFVVRKIADFERMHLAYGEE